MFEPASSEAVPELGFIVVVGMFIGSSTCRARSGGV